MSTDKTKVVGSVLVELVDSDGEVKDRRQVNNLVVDAGLDLIADRMLGAETGNAMTHMAVGTGGTAPAAGDTTLGTEPATGRVALDSSSVASNVLTYTATFPAGTPTGASNALQEAGIFSASSGGTMLCRATYSVINKGSSDSLVITWTVTIS